MTEDLAEFQTLSRGEQIFEDWRRRVGFWLAPVAFATVWLWPLPELNPQAHRLAAIMAAVVVLWMTEALALPVTALLGAAACVVLQVAPAKDVFAPFADPLMFLFIGSFILARGIFLHRLDRRLALTVLSLPWIGQRPSRILFAFGAITACLSGWISNTATTAMMFAIGMSILAFVLEQQRSGGPAVDRRYATALMLITSFAASIGGLATPVGTPPNVIGLGYIRESVGVEFTFFKWMIIGVPAVAVLYLVLFTYLNWLCPAGVRQLSGSRELIEWERLRLGAWTRGQRSTLIAFLATVVMWTLPGIVALVVGEQSEVYRSLTTCLPEAVAALLGALLLFILPGEGGERALRWSQAKEIDWGVVMLYGGGFALGVLSSQTGLAESLGRGFTRLLPLETGWTLLVASTLLATVVSEVTSNTASANIVVPVVISVANTTGADPLEPALGATLGASLGFMLPVSTPCNAIVYGSGYIPLGRMIRYGLLLDIAGTAVIVVLIKAVLPWLR